MDTNKIIIRNIIRVLGIIAGAAAGIAAYLFRKLANTSSEFFLTCCNVARISAIVLFVFAVAFMIYDVILKAYPISIATIGLALAAVAFIGSILIAPGASEDGVKEYIIKHVSMGSADAIAEKLARQLSIGTWMIIAGGEFFALYQAGCMKQGK